MFASPWHIYTQRSSALDDLYSLLCVAQFYIMNNRLPWVTYIIEQRKQGKNINYLDRKNFIKLRLSHQHTFDR